jgi:hypothetical protein
MQEKSPSFRPGDPPGISIPKDERGAGELFPDLHSTSHEREFSPVHPVSLIKDTSIK